ncbi:MAG TPA: response regulator [Vicinamibacteria bacterium]|nr:response regulator [Vicinamibacteria bacterium]
MAQPTPAPPPLVLVIDDVEDNRELYEQFFKHQGWRIETAADGEDGLAKASTLKPDVVILDLGLPRLDGWEVANRLKSAPGTSGIPVLALTGHVTTEARQRALTAGVDEFIAKPCVPADLVSAIRRHLK